VTDLNLTNLDQELDGAQLLDEVRRAVTRYVILPSEHAIAAVVLWIAATHAAPALHFFPRLAIRSPEKRCGKTRLLDLVIALCQKPLPTANLSAAVLYRVMGGDDPHTLLIDEADTIWGSKRQAENNEDLRGLVNAGFERGRPTYRYDAAARKVEALETFGFVALAGIGALPDTITDRAVNITMRRRRPGEKVDPYRSRRDGEPLADLRERVHAWAVGHHDCLSKAEPDLPVDDRAADVWEGLAMIADLAGGDWPAKCRAAALALTQEHDEDDAAGSDALRLLSDVRELFTNMTVSFLPSGELVTRLRGIEDAPWREQDLTVVKLADRLRGYKIVPRRNTAGTARGYRVEDFTDAFSRYLAGEVSEPVKPSNPQVNPPDAPERLTASTRQTSNGTVPLTRQSDDLTGSDVSVPNCAACGWPIGSSGHTTNCLERAA
jgi:hypothetical protein